MNPVRSIFQRLEVLILLASLVSVAAPAHALGTTLTVTGTADDLVMANLAVDPACNLREATEAANTGVSVGQCVVGPAPLKIAFGIGSGPQTIILAGLLPISGPVTIDGTTQPGYSGTPLIRIDGNNAQSTGISFVSGSAGSRMKGLMVTGFTSEQVSISTGNSVKHITLTGNYIGTDGTTTALGGTNGVRIRGGQYAQIGGPGNSDRNVISGNAENLSLSDGADFNRVQGNYIGTNASGTAAVPGSSAGVLVSSTIAGGASHNLIVGNVLSGNSYGVYIVSASDDNNIVRSNYIGTNASGTAAVAGSGYGINIADGNDNQIGGTSPGSGNLISGNVIGVNVAAPATGTIIRGNKIGTDKNGTGAIPNTAKGISLSDTVVDIGNATIPGKNVISGNSNASSRRGIQLSGAGTSGTTIMGNKIGINAAGTAALPNDYGIDLTGGASARIANNWIAENILYSVHIDGTSAAASASSNNCFTHNGASGLTNLNGTPAPFARNWWGAADGPTGAGPGTGDYVSTNVEFSSFLTTAPAACTILKNASFETGASNKKKPANWTLTGFDTATDKRDCAVGKAGKCSLELVGNGVQKAASQTVVKSGIGGDTFTFSLWSRAASVPAGSVYQMQVKFYNGGSLLSTQTKNFAVGTHGFKMISGTYSASGPYTKMTYKITFQAASGTAWFDVAGLSWTP